MASPMIYHARSPLGVLEGLGSIQPEALDEAGVPRSERLETTQWAAIGLTAGAGAISGAVLATAVRGNPVAGALVGVGGSALALAVFPPVWLTVERTSCGEPIAVAPAPPIIPSHAAAPRPIAPDRPDVTHPGVVVPSPRISTATAPPATGSGPAENRASSVFFGLGQGVSEVAVVRSYTRPSKATRVILGLSGVMMLGIGVLAASAGSRP